MESQKITFRCPSDLLAVLDDRIQQSGEDKTRVIIDALRYALGATDLPSDAVVGKSKLLELITRVAEVERKQDRLQKMVMDA
jgi:hypothetical protein